ncbi:N-acetyltransferase B complex non catalytic subunit-domain-containing protein [Endogone sp. FLAS-F59071]|nr:N-acetyltransferase B complex non catalytic subunit-domain-containing protein [Endogone sp. FLAS-F59071]|eukprot:RUS21743.1 N-acetyltransferase B complex non catalytic subunit-domain-containing protein [Endogone sp. FLAS-F59071]
MADPNERRLRPLYELIDNGQYKPALQLANKLLKKTPDALLVKVRTKLLGYALKAVALERTGKEEDALVLCQEIKKARPTDEAILQATTMVYRELGKHEEIVSIYEAAASQQPNNEEFGNHWFMAMVRNGDYKGQKEAALKLHKSFKNNKYLFWAIMSLVLQGEQSKTGPTNLFYTLAERMMLKSVEENRVNQTEELRLYLLILLSQNKHSDALAVLSGDLGAKGAQDPEIRQMKVELLMANEKWPEANAGCKRVLKDEWVSSTLCRLFTARSDDWISWTAYLDSLFHIIADEAAVEGEGPVDHTRSLDEAREFINSQKGTSDRLKRGPFLAELELELRIKDKENADPAHLVDLAASYFERFGSKAVCFSDLQPYVGALATDTSAAREFVDRLVPMVVETTEQVGPAFLLICSIHFTLFFSIVGLYLHCYVSFAIPHLLFHQAGIIRNLQKQINIRKFERYLGLHAILSVADSVKLVDTFWDEFVKALPLGSELETTERQYGDDYVILAVHVLVDLYHRSESAEEAFLVQAMAILEYGLGKSKHNFQFKLLLVRLYLLLGWEIWVVRGVFNRALETYRTMDIKHVQHDTLSHYLTDRCVMFWFFDQAGEVLKESLSIYKSNEVETPEMVVKAYQFATFSKIQEFIKFHERLENSLQQALVNVAILRLETLQHSFTVKNALQFYQGLDVSALKYDDAFLQSRSDNRDLVVMLNCNPAGGPTPEELTRAATHVDATWFKIFTLVVLAVKRANGGEVADVEEVASALATAVDGEDIASHLTPQELQLAKVVSRLASAYVLAKKAPTENGAEATKAGDLIKEASSILENDVTSFAAGSHSLEFSWSRFHAYATTLETCTYGLMLAELINRSFSTGKPAKKGAQPPGPEEIVDQLQQLNAVLKSSLAALQKEMKGVKERVKSSAFTKDLITRLTVTSENKTAYIADKVTCLIHLFRRDNHTLIT